MSVQEYLDKYMLSRKIEDAVNAAVRAKSNDPVLFIVSFFNSISPLILLNLKIHSFSLIFLWFYWKKANHMINSVNSVITKVKARQILDSRGIPTIEVELSTNKGTFRASAPSGPSTGLYVSFCFLFIRDF